MLGVVIWTCQRTGQAIVWCSDGRDLAHFDGAGPADSVGMIAVGDLVEVSFGVAAPLRRAASLRLVEAGYMPEVAQQLHSAVRRRAIAAA